MNSRKAHCTVYCTHVQIQCTAVKELDLEGVAGIRAAITSYQGRTARGGPYPTQLLEIKTVLALNLARNSRLANLDPALTNGRLKSKLEFE